MDKFCLKWNDFQTTVAKSFGLLRKEKDFFDVTLVSDDQVQIPAHKLVLSACSSFFKTILKQNSHSHPLIYITGISSTNLGFIMDYIYQGEVQIYQEQLDSFLDSAQKLQVAGLLSGESKREDELKEEENYNSNHIDESNEDIEKPVDNNHDIESNSLVTSETKKNSSGSRFRYLLDSQTESEVKSKIKEILTKSDGQYICNVCGKTGRDVGNMSKHAETHIEGISYPCEFCENTFRSSRALKAHTSRFHI